MKLFSQSILTTLIALTSLTSFAGDYCFSPGRDCNVGGSSASCCDNTGYLFGYGGFSFSNDFTARLIDSSYLRNGLANAGLTAQTIANSLPPRESIELDSGFIIGGGAGVRSCFLGGSRFEIEGLYTENDISAIRIPAFTTNLGNQVAAANAQNVSGEISTAALMFNFLKEVPIGCITGYAGAGIGVAMTESSINFAGDYLSDSDFAIAHQFIVGADLPVSDCLSLFLQYKLFNRGDITVNCPSGVNGVSKPSEFEGSYQSHLVMGARVHF